MTRAEHGPQRLDPRVKGVKIPVIESEDLGVKMLFECKESDEIEAE